MGTLDITIATWRAMFPHAPSDILVALDANKQFLDRAGLLSDRRAFTYCFANCGEETGGFTIPHLTESSAYTPARALQVWPGRVSQIRTAQQPGSVPGATFGERLFNFVYADRMGNGPPSSGDGSRFRGRGGPQLTGRDEYGLLARATGLPLLGDPESAGDGAFQDQIIGAYWTSKGLKQFSDSGNFTGLVRRWNGGLIGYADRVAYLNRITPIVARLAVANHIDKVLDGNIHVPIDDIADGQRALNQVREDYGQTWDELDIDDAMGVHTHAALVAYQSWRPEWRADSLKQWGDHDLDVDGLFGPRSYAALQYDIEHAAEHHV